MKRAFLVLLMLLSSVVHCMGEAKVIVAAADPWPPFIDPEHPKGGLSLEIVRASFATQGYEVKMEIVPWARAEDGVKSGSYDILPNTWLTEKRKSYLLYSEPYAANEVKFVKKAADPFEFNGMASLSGKTVGTVRGYGYGDEFLNATSFKREEAANIMANVKKLVHSDRRIDLTLEDEIVARATIKKEDPGLLSQVAFTKNALSKNSLYVTTGLANPRHKEIIDAFNKGLAAIKASGEYAAILKGYGVQ